MCNAKFGTAVIVEDFGVLDQWMLKLSNGLMLAASSLAMLCVPAGLVQMQCLSADFCAFLCPLIWNTSQTLEPDNKSSDEFAKIDRANGF